MAKTEVKNKPIAEGFSIRFTSDFPKTGKEALDKTVESIKSRLAGQNRAPYVSTYSSSSKIATLLYALAEAMLVWAIPCEAVAVGENRRIGEKDQDEGIGYIAEIHLEKFFADLSTVAPSSEPETTASLFVYINERTDGTLAIESMAYPESSFVTSPYKADVHGQDKVWVALMPYLARDTEFSECLRSLKEALAAADEESAIASLFKASDNVYRRYKNGDILQGLSLDDVPELDRIGLIGDMYEPERVLHGKFRVIDASSAIAEDDAGAGKENGIESFKDRYHLPTSNQERVVDLPSWIKVNPLAVDIAQTVQKTSESPLPIRNIMLAGPAGTGKSSIAEQVAYMLGMPLKRDAGNADMDIEAITGKISPVREGDKEYYMHVDTPFVEIFRNGGVYEFQEFSALRPGVLLGINSMLQEGCLTVPCRDRAEMETIFRHPNAVFVFTTNVDYEGCRQVNQSVIDRFMVFHVDALSLDEMCSRAMSASGLTDKVVAMEMTKFVKEVAENMERTGVDDGVCGMRSLILWMTLVACGQDIKKSCETAVINKTSFEKEVRDSLREAQNHFSIFNRSGYANPRRRKK